MLHRCCRCKCRCNNNSRNQPLLIKGAVQERPPQIQIKSKLHHHLTKRSRRQKKEDVKRSIKSFHSLPYHCYHHHTRQQANS